MKRGTKRRRSKADIQAAPKRIHRSHRDKVRQQGPEGAEFRCLVPMACIRLEIENSWCTSKGCRVQNLGVWDAWRRVVPFFRSA